MICIICNGEYPESKHDFINCISLDFKYDIHKKTLVIKKNIIPNNLIHNIFLLKCKIT